jgi:osmoprotectant transport system permease protein
LEEANLVFFAVVIALCLGLPLGVFIYKKPRFRTIALGTVSILWTIPSLALLAFFIPFLGIGVVPAIVVLSLYAILPILRNTVTALEEVDPAALEAADGLGFTRWQRLRLIELPLAKPMIMTGIRTAVSMSVGVATLAAFIGAGGLGDFINQGLALNDSRLILLGAIPAAMMAVLLDFIIGRLEKKGQIKNTINRPSRRKTWRYYLLTGFALIILAFSFFTYKVFFNNKSTTVTVGTKNFSESFLLGYLITDMLKAHTHLQVRAKFDLAGTAVCQAALKRGAIDMYPEYTGTAYTTVLHRQDIQSSQQVLHAVRQAYEKRWQLTWLPPFGYNNTQAVIVTQKFAQKYQLHTISDLKKLKVPLVIGASAAFKKRPDGLIGLKKVYHLHFQSIKQMDLGLTYKAIAHGDVNMISASSTDGLIPAYHLKILKDDKKLYPPYDAAVVIRQQTLKQYPKIYKALKPLFGAITNRTIQKLNYQVDVEGKSPAEVARQFLLKRKLLSS